MREHALYQELLDGAREERWLLWRIEDGSLGRKPFDIAGADARGTAVGLEVKVIRAPQKAEAPLPWELFSTHQQAWLRLYADHRALALILLYHEADRRMELYYLPHSQAMHTPRCHLFVGELLRERQMWRGWTEAAHEIARHKPRRRRLPVHGVLTTMSRYLGRRWL